jgi:hypothetical protein
MSSCQTKKSRLNVSELNKIGEGNLVVGGLKSKGKVYALSSTHCSNVRRARSRENTLE